MNVKKLEEQWRKSCPIVKKYRAEILLLVLLLNQPQHNVPLSNRVGTTLQ